ncbi:MAG: FAD/NAD(P)-binding oxidoreductase [Gemmatimonadaceae bacterium]|nr:FAD/NAD(P)-binding oxidoreductase [Gemmatimonadaceae bacterium]
MPHTVLILGGGVGGVVAANRLRRLLPADDRIVVVERLKEAPFGASMPWLVSGHRSSDSISRSARQLLHPRIELVTGDIDAINPDTREVSVGGRRLVGDSLIIALGAALAPERIPGMAKAGFNIYDGQGADALRQEMTRFNGGRLVVLTAAPMYKCPAAPYETALLLEDLCRQRGIRDAVDVQLIAAEAAPMGVAGPTVSAAVREMLEMRGIAYLPEHQVSGVDPVAKRLQFTNGVEASFDLLAFVPPHVAPSIVTQSGLAGDSGWMSADRSTLETQWSGVYALGDVVSFPLAMGKPLPRAGVFARAQAQVVARNIAAKRRGRAATARFDGHGMCFVETGGGKAGIGRGNFYAEPVPTVALHAPGRVGHLVKVLFEQQWLRGWA